MLPSHCSTLTEDRRRCRGQFCNRRVPKRQQTVKVEPLDRLHGAPCLDCRASEAEADRIEHRDRRRVQERQVAERGRAACSRAPAVFGSIFFSLASQAMRVVLVAELIDQLERDGLAAGEHAPVGDAASVGIVELPALLHQAAEPGIGIHDDRLDRRARLRRSSARSRSGAALSGEDLISSTLTPTRLQQLGEVRILEQHADRADQRGLLRDDVIGGQSRRCSRRMPRARRPRPPAASSPSSRIERIVELLGAGGRAARAVDVHDHRLRATICPSRSSASTRSLIVADQSRDRDARDVGAGRRQTPCAAASQRGCPTTARTITSDRERRARR